MTAPPVLLDISRLMGRAGLGPDTGIDRVERAYLEHFSRGDRPFLALVTLEGGRVALLDGQAATGLLSDLVTPPAILSRRARTRRLIGRRALWAGPLGQLPKALGQHLPGGGTGGTLVTVGHTGLRSDLFAALRAGGIARIVAMIHDVIPLDHPEFTRTRTIPTFRARLEAAASGADLLLYPSAFSKDRAEAALARLGWRVPPSLVLVPGIEPPRHAGRRPEPKHFVVLGTIEPRKGHDLLLDLWRGLPPGEAELHVIGRRGWAEDALFRRLTTTRGVVEHGALPDAEVATHLARAAALLFPSRVEGAGLPVGEALAAGVPVIARDLPPLRELFGNGPDYIPGDNLEMWQAAIRTAAHNAAMYSAPSDGPTLDFRAPCWHDHFKTLESYLK